MNTNASVVERTEPMKIHTYHISFYTTGGFLKEVWVKAISKADAMSYVNKHYTVIEMYCVRFVD